MTPPTNSVLKQNYYIYKENTINNYIAISPDRYYRTYFYKSIFGLTDALQKKNIHLTQSSDFIGIKLDYICRVKDLYNSNPEYFI
jgi:hypothetical protein